MLFAEIFLYFLLLLLFFELDQPWENLFYL